MNRYLSRSSDNKQTILVAAAQAATPGESRLVATNPDTGTIDSTLLPPGREGYTHQQPNAAQVWAIAHGLGYTPSITCWNSDGEEIIGNPVNHGPNAASVVFALPVAGKAYCV